MRQQIVVAQHRAGEKLLSSRFLNPHRIDHSGKQACAEHRSLTARIVQLSPHPALLQFRGERPRNGPRSERVPLFQQRIGGQNAGFDGVVGSLQRQHVHHAQTLSDDESSGEHGSDLLCLNDRRSEHS